MTTNTFACKVKELYLSDPLVKAFLDRKAMERNQSLSNSRKNRYTYAKMVPDFQTFFQSYNLPKSDMASSIRAILTDLCLCENTFEYGKERKRKVRPTSPVQTHQPTIKNPNVQYNSEIFQFVSAAVKENCPKKITVSKDGTVEMEW